MTNKFSRQARLLIATGLIMLGANLPARADLLILAGIGTLSFGPFTPTKTIIITGTIVNVSNQDVTVCEGICVGETYSLGAGAFSPYGYTFSFGDGSDPGTGFLDGEARGTYAPGQEKSFIFGEYTLDGGSAASQRIFAIGRQSYRRPPPDRLMVGSSSFGGTIQVVSAPEPSAWAMMLLGFVSLGLAGRRRRAKTNSPAFAD